MAVVHISIWSNSLHTKIALHYRLHIVIEDGSTLDTFTVILKYDIKSRVNYIRNIHLANCLSQSCLSVSSAQNMICLIIEGVWGWSDSSKSMGCVCVCVCLYWGGGGSQECVSHAHAVGCVPRCLHGAVSLRSRVESLSRWSMLHTPLRPIGRGVRPRPLLPHRVWNDEWERGRGEKWEPSTDWFQVKGTRQQVVSAVRPSSWALHTHTHKM